MLHRTRPHVGLFLRQADAFAGEDGVRGAFEAFFRQLPIADMVCDVSLLLPPAYRKARVARYRSGPLGLKVGAEVCAVLARRLDPAEWEAAAFLPWR